MMKSIWRAFEYLKQYKWAAIGGIFSLILVNMSNLITPQILRYLIDTAIAQLDLSAMLRVVAALMLVAFVRGLFNFLQGYLSEVASQGVAFELRNAIFEKLQQLSFSYHDQAQTGKLMTRMTSDVEIVRQFLGQGFMQMISSAFMLIGVTVLLLVMNWRLALIDLAVIPLIGVVFLFLVIRVFPISREVQQKLGELNTTFQENLAGARVVKAFVREPYEKDRYEKQNNELLNINLKFIRLFTTYFPLVFFIANLGTIGIVWIGGLQVMSASLTIGELVAFIGYLGLLLQPIFSIGMVSAMLSRSEASAQRIFDVLDARPEVQEKTNATELKDVQGEVVFEHVSFRYQSMDQDVVSDLNFSVKPGQTIAILGKTGSGKSTIINLVPRFYDVTEGRVLIDGKDVRDLSLSSLRRSIGIVLQETTLFSGTIRENIAYGLPDAPEEDVIQAARAAQAHEFIMLLQDGYNSIVRERGVGLSGGQKQRIAIARALLVNPQILIMDDSTTAVDAETEYQIQVALDDLMKGRTSFVIAQRISTVRKADQILLLDGGIIAANGTHDQLIQSSEMYVDIVNTQLGERGRKILDAIQGESS